MAATDSPGGGGGPPMVGDHPQHDSTPWATL